MRHFDLKSTPHEPVSHDPALLKQVLMKGGIIPGLAHISHIVLEAGATASTHAHTAHEVFFCTGGEVVFNVSGRDVRLSPGAVLVIEPGEAHSITDTPSRCSLFYLRTTDVNG